MRLKDISLPTPLENILFDDCLLTLAEKGLGGEVLRFWESPKTFIVLGATGKINEDVNQDAARKDHIPILRRTSGGGTVLQGKGCLNFAFVLSKEKNPRLNDLRESYQIILNQVIAIMKDLHVEAVFRPSSDLALVERRGVEKKFSGNAQRRARKYILHHGTILYDFDLISIGRYLKIPRDVPSYRQGRSHEEFVTNIPLTVKTIKNAFQEFLGLTQVEYALNDVETQCLKDSLAAD